MIKNYFKTAFRCLWRNKSTSFINLFGLSVGMTVSVFILLWVLNELGFDSYHPDADKIFRITHSIATNKDESWVWELSPMALGPAAASEVPEVQQMARASIRTDFGPSFKIKNQLFGEKSSAFVDKSWFQLFHYDFIAGNAEAFSKDPFGIVLTQTEATKYSGSAGVCKVNGIIDHSEVASRHFRNLYRKLSCPYARPVLFLCSRKDRIILSRYATNVKRK